MRTFFYLLLFAIISPSLVLAQSSDLLFAPSTKVTKGGTFLKADALASSEYVDNYLFQDRDLQNTFVNSLAATGLMQVEDKKTLWNINGQVSYSRIAEFSEDDHTDYSLNADYHYKPNTKLELKANVFLANRFVYRGQEISLGQGNELDSGNKLKDKGLSFTTNYGSEGSIAKLNASIGMSGSAYSEFRQNVKIFDVERSFIKLGGDYLLSGKSYISVESSFTRSEFEHDQIRNNDTVEILSGLKWSSSEISKLAFLLGYQQLNFKNGNFDKQSKFTWRVNYQWKPYDSVFMNFTSGRRFDDSQLALEAFRIVDKHIATLNYVYHRRLIFAANIGYINDVSVSNAGKRDLEYGNFGGAIKYQWRQRIHFYLQSGINTLDSNVSELNYDRFNASLGLKVRI